MKINKIEKIMDAFVVRNDKFTYYAIIMLGLDATKKLKLIKNENLRIAQKLKKKKKLVKT